MIAVVLKLEIDENNTEAHSSQVYPHACSPDALQLSLAGVHDLNHFGYISLGFSFAVLSGLGAMSSRGSMQ